MCMWMCVRVFTHKCMCVRLYVHVIVHVHAIVDFDVHAKPKTDSLNVLSVLFLFLFM